MKTPLPEGVRFIPPLEPTIVAILRRYADRLDGPEPLPASEMEPRLVSGLRARYFEHRKRHPEEPAQPVHADTVVTRAMVERMLTPTDRAWMAKHPVTEHGLATGPCMPGDDIPGEPVVWKIARKYGDRISRRYIRLRDIDPAARVALLVRQSAYEKKHGRLADRERLVMNTYITQAMLDRLTTGRDRRWKEQHEQATAVPQVSATPAPARRLPQPGK